MNLLKSILRQILVSASIVCASMIVFISCDSREDWFAKEGEGATFVIKTYRRDGVNFERNPERHSFRNDTVYSQEPRVVTYDLRVTDVIDGMGYFSEPLGIEIEGVGQKVEGERGTEWSVTTTYSTPELVEDYKGLPGDKRKEIHFAELYKTPGVKNDTVAVLLNTADIVMELMDAFRNKVYCHVKVNLWSDIPPIPVMKIKDIEGSPMEKVLSLSKSYDKDGSVSKYEYCIDGNVREYNYPKFEIEGDCCGGKGAYGGAYITATELSEVKHAFQAEGEHIVYYRCMDNLGLWSLWYNALITVDK